MKVSDIQLCYLGIRNNFRKNHSKQQKKLLRMILKNKIKFGCIMTTIAAFLSSCTTVFSAARNGDLEALQQMIAEGESVNQQDDEGMTPLHEAVKSGQYDAAKFLIDKGAVVSAQAVGGNTPLHVSAGWGQAKTAKLLIEQKADILSRNNSGWVPLHNAACFGHDDVVRLLVAEGTPVDTVENIKNTPLHIAAEKGETKTAKLLLSLKADINKQNKNGATPLYLAAYHGMPDTVAMLISQGANINIPCGSWTPLGAALYYKYRKTARHLMNAGACLNSYERNKIGGLLEAAIANNSDLASMYIDAGANLNERASNQKSGARTFSTGDGKTSSVFVYTGDTPLHIAIKRRNWSLAEKLIRAGANVNQQNDRGDAPLHCLLNAYDIGYDNINRVREPIARLLISNGADVNMKGAYGNSPLKLAEKHYHSGIAQMLIQAGARYSYYIRPY